MNETTYVVIISDDVDGSKIVKACDRLKDAIEAAKRYQCKRIEKWLKIATTDTGYEIKIAATYDVDGHKLTEKRK